MKPLRQGKLDSLCGIYAVINALQWCVLFNDAHRRELFSIMVKKLEGERYLSKALTGGTYKKHVNRMLDSTVPFIQKHWKKEVVAERVFTSPPSDIRAYWKGIQDFMEEEDAYKRVVLIGLDGKHRHWTCIKHASAKRFTLYDSGELKHIDRKRCTLGATVSKPHLLDANEVWGIRLTSMER
jgi:hypothetical protein